ncbi:DUF4252 domain-containing protein [Myroides sp. LJL119]
MRKIIIYTAILLLTTVQISLAQSDEFTKFESNKQVNSIVVNKKMFDMMSNVKIDPNNSTEKDYFDAIKKINSLRVYTTTQPKVKDQMLLAINQYVGSKKLKQHASKNTPEATITIYINNNGTEKDLNNFLSFHESTKGKEHIIFIVEGHLSLQEINAVAKKMDLPIKEFL